LRQYFLPINLQRFLFFPAHQIDVELSDARLNQSMKLFTMCLDRTDQAKAIHYFIRHKIGVVAADLAMVLVIILPSILNVGSQRRRELFRLV